MGNKPYYKFYKDILFDERLTSSNERICLMLLVNRMGLSIQHPKYFDKKVQEYFVIYTQEQMAKDAQIDKKTVGTIYKHLEKLGIIKRKKRFNAADLIFLPLREKITSTEGEKLPPSKNNNINNTDNTVNTAKPAEKQKVNPIDKWRQAVIRKSKLPEQAVDAILSFAHNDLSLAYKIIGLINKAKYITAKKHHLLNSKEASYESNLNIRQKIAVKLQYIFNYAQNMDNAMGYIMKCLQTFFLDAFGVHKDEYVKPQAQSKNAINHKLPERMKQKYDPEKNKIDPEKKRRVEAMIRQFTQSQPMQS